MTNIEVEKIFKVHQILGEGTYGIVYKLVDKEGNEYAYKRIMSQLVKRPGAHTESLREADILNRLNKNPRIVNLKMISLGCPPTDKPLSPLKMVDKTPITDDLLHFLFENAHCNMRKWFKENKLSFDQMKQFMVDILLGAESIALSEILHRDLNPSNILIYKPGNDILTSEIIKTYHTPSPDAKEALKTPVDFKKMYRAKICDFGLAVPNVRDKKRSKGVVTAWYRAPEIIGENQDYGTKSDAWSVGCIFFEMLFRVPFTGKVDDSKSELVAGIFRNATYKFSEHEIRKILGCNKKKHTASHRPIKSRIINNKPLKTMIINRDGNMKRKILLTTPLDPESLKIVEELSDVISSLLIIDPEKRSSITDILNLPIFKSHRAYIELFRENYPPRYPYEYKYDIRNTKCRKNVTDYIISIYNNRQNYDWYTDRAFFHSLDLFDRDIRYHIRINNPITDTNDSELHFFSCLYLSIRYFCTLSSPFEPTDILPNHIQKNSKNLDKLSEIELIILLDVIEYSFYRYGAYEAISELDGDNIDYESLYREAVIVLSQNINFANGLTPTELAFKLFENIE
jgi:serine/threonine protein kinase